MEFYPTNHCFDDALEFIQRRCLCREPDPWYDYHVVHGICRAGGERYAHAWVEKQETEVVQGFLVQGERVWMAAQRELFYVSMRVEQFTRYTVRQALRENRRTGYLGPWRAEYIALCGDDKTVRRDPELVAVPMRRV